MMNFDERAVPGLTSNYLMCEAQARYKFACTLSSSSFRVLDMACGSGYGTDILSKKNKEVIGIDISDEALIFARGRYRQLNVTFLKNSVYDTIFRDRSFDIVVAYEMIEHLSQVQKFLREVGRVMKKDGTFLLSTPNAAYSSPDGKLMSPFHTKEYSFHELEKVLQKSFSEVVIYSQVTSKKANAAHNRFMDSQSARAKFVSSDILSVRKLIPKSVKEKLWKSIGSLFGRGDQETLTVSDFPIRKGILPDAHYIVAVCKRPK